MRKAVVYCDESGNTGGNYIDPTQLFYVLAGWWTYEDNDAKVTAIVNEILQKHISGSAEIKGAALVKTKKGQESILYLIKQLGQARCVPIFFSAEKRYCVAAKIVETFLDPVYNKSVSYNFWNDANLKQDTADILYLLPDTTLNNFAVAYRHPDVDALLDALHSICDSLTKISHYDLADLISGSAKEMKEIVEAEIGGGEVIPGSAYPTLNMPAFLSFICTIEQVSRLAKIDEVSVLHDEAKEFCETYQWVFKAWRDGKRHDVYLSNGTIIPLGFQFLKHLNFADSATTPMIQASDLLSSSLFYLLTSIQRGYPIKPGLASLGKALLPATMVEPQVGGLIASKQMLRKIAEFFHAVSKQSEKHDKE
jgi:hypothetical protein